MRRREFFLPAALTMFAGCGRKDPTGLRTLQIGVINYAGTSPFYVAKERDYFRQAGINVVPQMVGRSAEIIGLVAAGSLHAAVAVLEPALLNVAARGSDMRIVLGRDRVTLGCGSAGALYVRQMSFPHGSGDIQAWSGKKIWSGQGAGIAEFLLDTVLARSGVDPKRMPQLRLNRPQAAAALLSGSIDGIFLGNNSPLDFSPHSGILREDAGRKILAGLQTSYIVFGPALRKGDLSVGASFLDCYLRGVRDFESGVTPQFLRDFSAAEGVSSSAIRQCRTYGTPGGAIDKESIEVALDWAVTKGYTPAGVSLDSIIDGRFLELMTKRGAG